MSRIAALLVLACATTALPGVGHAWTKSFLVEWAELAHYYGGSEAGGEDAPGTDCPRGTNPEMDWQKVLTTPYRSAKEVETIRSPEYRNTAQQVFYRHLAFRGPNKENVYENPTAVNETPLLQVEGKLAEGFNLDGDAATGFTGVDGTMGVDNAFYKATGCIIAYRGKARKSYSQQTANESMRMGSWSTVVVMSGSGDPMNDDDVTIGIYNSKDRMVKDAGGLIAADYTFRIDPDPEYQTVFKATIKDGVVEAQKPIFLRTHDITLNDRINQMKLYRTRIRWELKPDGTMTGLVGGYREWFTVWRDIAGGYRPNGDPTRGGPRENLGRFSIPTWYVALRDAADGLPDPKTGKNLGISVAYRFHMLPAFVVAPGADQSVEVARIYSK